MKNTILILLALTSLGLFLVSGCTKCETCTQTITTTVSPSTPGYPQTQTSTFDACGDNLKQVDRSTSNSTVTSGGVRVTATMKTNCY